ncbi:MAG: AAC(3) family N-acetyltransferase [Anaerolineae bacterium]|nr:AAC(3) family N-acetyltransferase [Anaerolineae bacterium]
MPSELSKEQIVAGLRSLGLPLGATLMVHSSLSSLGTVADGADAVIDALLEALGPEGTLLMPTHPARDGRTFDPAIIPSEMGIVTETFRLRPGVLRSRHPYHPVAAYGPRAGEMLRDHERSAIPDGPDTPYGRLIARSGWVLHVGCDLDTLTLLHAVEAELDLPYLRELDMEYVDAGGDVQMLHIVRCPGGHRGGVFKFDRLFREEGAMTIGRIGQAVCRLLSAPRAAAIMRREMVRDPFFALDDNPHCADCVRFRGKVKAARLAQEEFCLTAPLGAVSHDLDEAMAVIQGEGISWVEVEGESLGPSPASWDDLRSRLAARGLGIAVLHIGTQSPEAMAAWCSIAARLHIPYLHIAATSHSSISRAHLVDRLRALAQMAGEHKLTLLLGNEPGSLAGSADELAALISEVGSSYVRAGYDPSAIALAGGSPFYGGLYKGSLRGYVQHLDLRDAVAATGRPAPPGLGNAEIVETISNLRCRSFAGLLCLWPLPMAQPEGFRTAARHFWQIIESI